MNKSELIALIAKTGNYTKLDAEQALQSVVGSISQAMRDDKDVNLLGFGSFKVRLRKAKTGRNPKTGEAISCAEYKQPVFKAGKTLKDACNNR